MLVITAALSLQDPRERPVEQRAQADQKHARFTDPTSDFLTWLSLWRYLRTQQHELSSSAFRRMCRAEYLNYLRVREWQELESRAASPTWRLVDALITVRTLFAKVVPSALRRVAPASIERPASRPRASSTARCPPR